MNTTNKTFFWLSLLLCLGLLSGCGRKEQDSASSHVTGNLSYGEPVQLPADSVLELRLTDVSVSDGPAVEIAKAVVTDVHSLPYAYSLGYDASKIDPQHRYTIDARVLSNGIARFATDTAYEVLTQGHGAQRDITVIASGINNPTTIFNASNNAHTDGAAAAVDQTVVFQNELRAGNDISLYKAGIQEGHIGWLEEDRSDGTPQPLHARYEFKGALLMHYMDSSSLEIKFDERGRPSTISKNQQLQQLSAQAATISAVRNRAELLRSHALAASDARAHRLATGG